MTPLTRVRAVTTAPVVIAVPSFFTVLVLTLAIAAGASAGRPPTSVFGPNAKYCQSFVTPREQFLPHGYKVYVYAIGMRCSTARTIEHEYWFAPDRRKIYVNGGSGAAGYTLLKRYPGWRCDFGAGDGGCTKGKAEAAASVEVNRG